MCSALARISKINPASVAVAALFLLSACGADELAQTTISGICDTAAARRLVGKFKPTDADAMIATGATLVRQIAPGDPVTHDLRANRVTIETDRLSDRVVDATCG
jgi:hypothetical protein